MSGIDKRESGNTRESTGNGIGRKEEEVIDVDKDINTDQIMREEVVKRTNTEDDMMNTNGKKSKSDDEPWKTAPKGGCNGNGGMQGRGRGSRSGHESGKGIQNNKKGSEENAEQTVEKLSDYLQTADLVQNRTNVTRSTITQSQQQEEEGSNKKKTDVEKTNKGKPKNNEVKIR